MVLTSISSAVGEVPALEAKLGLPALEVPGAPNVTKVEPATGPLAGGTTVTLTGSNFLGASQVDFGATPASFSVISANKMEAVAPAGAEGTVDITVSTPEGTSAVTSADRFSYVPPGPSVLELQPSKGPVAGGQEVRIHGAHLDTATEVHFGAVSVPFVIVSSETLHATAPQGEAPTVDVRVTTPEGISAVSPGDAYSYVSKYPEISGVTPNKGPAAGGNAVTISGSEFYGVTDVKFGARSASGFTINSPLSITAVAPPATVEKTTIEVETTFGPSALEWCVRRGNKGPSCSIRDYYKYLEPTVTGVTPSFGPASGGTTMTLTGSGFGLAAGETQVTIDKLPATSVNCSSTTTCTAVTPAHKAGPAKVLVNINSNEPKHSKASPAAVFHYE
jgi:hypothetical protein